MRSHLWFLYVDVDDDNRIQHHDYHSDHENNNGNTHYRHEHHRDNDHTSLNSDSFFDCNGTWGLDDRQGNRNNGDRADADDFNYVGEMDSTNIEFGYVGAKRRGVRAGWEEHLLSGRHYCTDDDPESGDDRCPCRRHHTGAEMERRWHVARAGV